MPLFRLLVILGLVALGCAGCGRRGPLESPVAASSPAPAPSLTPSVANPISGPAALSDTIGLGGGGTQPGDPTLPQVPDVTGVAQAPTQSSRSQRRNYVIPREPFPLDPLL
jgi:predicted small lipoprotein YifL